MDLPSIHSNNLTTKNTTVSINSSNETLDISKLSLNQTLTAKLDKTYALKQSQLELVTKLITKQPQLAKLITSPDNQQTPIATPENSLKHTQIKNLVLAELSALGKKLFVLTTVTTPIPPKVQLKVGPDNSLILLNQSSDKAAQKTNTDARNSDISKQNSSPSSILGSASQGMTKQQSALINQGLRQHLPNQASTTQLLTHLQNITSAINKNTSLQTSVLGEIVNVTKSAAVSSALSADAINGVQLEKKLHQSGFSLENSLRQLAKQTTTSHTPSQPYNQGNKTQQSNEKLVTSNNLFTSPNMKTQGATLNTSPESLLKDDQKALLLRLHSLIGEMIATYNTPITPTKNHKPEDLAQLLFNILNKKAPTDYGAKQRQNTPSLSEVLQQLQSMVMSSVSKITSLQIRHLLLAGQDPNMTQSGTFVELPVRFGETLVPVQLHIKEFQEKEDDPSQDNKEDKPPVRHWNVFMELEVDDFGYFATEISLRNENIKTKFWIESNELEKAAKQKLDSLKNELNEAGVEVKELLIATGSPPYRSTGIQQTLVDVRT